MDYIRFASIIIAFLSVIILYGDARKGNRGAMASLGFVLWLVNIGLFYIVYYVTDRWETLGPVRPLWSLLWPPAVTLHGVLTHFIYIYFKRGLRK